MISTENRSDRILKARKLVNRKLIELDLKVEEKERHNDDMIKFSEWGYEADQLVQLFQDATTAMYSTISNKIGNIVSEGLAIVFPDSPYKFIIQFESRRNTVEADFYLQDEDGELFDPLKDVGGGVSDLIALLLRIVYLLLSKYDNILIADEPLKFIDRERIEDATEFVRTLCEEFNFQMLVVTHIPEMIKSSEVVYRSEKKNKICTLTKIQ